MSAISTSMLGILLLHLYRKAFMCIHVKLRKDEAYAYVKLARQSARVVVVVVVVLYIALSRVVCCVVHLCRTLCAYYS